MKQYNLNQVFLDTENFSEPKRLKCVEDTTGSKNICSLCIYSDVCAKPKHIARCMNPIYGTYDYFIETDEPLTTPHNLVVKPINHKPHKLFEEPYEYYT